ncbi:MAG: TldD/PmbA family protein [Nitrososphaerota archaeon]|nr:TldD/PmbA family protein [Nitrososphaerota archaeon]
MKSLNETAIATAQRLGVDDAVALSIGSKERMLRFANNSATVIEQIDETELTVYLAKGGRRAIASTSNPQESSVRRFVSELFSSLKHLPVSDYASLPSRAIKYSPKREMYDGKIATLGEQLPKLAETAISASLQAGAKRSAGVIEASVVSYDILTSAGTRGADARTSLTLNIRAFSDGDASGHGLSCTSSLSAFDPEGAGRRAGEAARQMVNATEPEAGTYDVLLSPAVASNLIESVAWSSSAFSVEAGLSYLADRVGKGVASENFDLTDHGRIKGGLGGRSFDDEGMPTRSTPIIKAGVLQGYLHNLTSAKRWRTSTTGNAGLVSPHAWNLEVGKGDSDYDEMVKTTKRGIVLTSNWYTRFKNYRTGEFSTVPRDGAFLVENGSTVKSLKGMRLSDDLLRMFSSVRMLSKKREWIEWWEVDTPTLCPWVLVEGARITRAYE